jgi:hypothetical protein
MGKNNMSFNQKYDMTYLIQYAKITGITTTILFFGGMRSAYLDLKNDNKRHHTLSSYLKSCFIGSIKGATLGAFLPIIIIDYSLYCIIGFGLPFFGPYSLSINRP